MKRTLSLILTFILLLMPFAHAESDELTRLRAENAALKEELSKLQARVSYYLDPTVVAVYDGGCVTFDEIYDDYEWYLQLFTMFGMDISASPDDLLELQVSLIDDCIASKLIDAYIEKSGVNLLTAEEEASLLLAADEEYEHMVSVYMFSYGNETEESARLLAENDLAMEGFTREEVRAYYLEKGRNPLIIDLIVGDIQLTEADIQTIYEEKLAEDQAYYTEFPEEFISSDESGFSLWAPEGYRVARVLMIPCPAEYADEADELLFLESIAESDTELAEIQTKLTDLREKINVDVENVLARLAAGETFEALCTEMNPADDQVGMLTSSEGIFLSLYSWEELAQPLMALTEPGQLTAPIPYGADTLILQYVADVTPGAVPLADVHDKLEALALETIRASHYEEIVNGWMQEANIEYLLNRLNG